jgi:hypothetical protein
MMSIQEEKKPDHSHRHVLTIDFSKYKTNYVVFEFNSMKYSILVKNYYREVKNMVNLLVLTLKISQENLKNSNIVFILFRLVALHGMLFLLV